LVALGTLIAASGVYFVAVGFDLIPLPSKVNGPLWLSVFVGLIFGSAGVSLLVRGATGMDDQGSDLPANTPRWAATIYWLSSVAAGGGLAALGTWVAFGAGTRHFSMSGFFSGPLNETIGRSVFGFGTIIAWLVVAVLAWAGAKKVFARKI